MQQIEFDFEIPTAPEGTKNQLRVCKECNSNFYYFEFRKKDGSLDIEKNKANPSYMNYCCRKCFIKGLYKAWGTTPYFPSLMVIEDVSAKELQNATA